MKAECEINEAVETAINQGMSVEQFIEACRMTWNEVLREKAARDAHAWERLRP